MSDQFSTSIAGPSGRGRTDAGDHYHTIVEVNQTINCGSLADVKGRPFKTKAADDLLWLHRRFVPPLGTHRAREILARHGAVLLCGDPGSGRRATAQMLLYELRSGEDAFHELSWNDEGPGRLLALDDITDGAALLLDLSTVDPDTWARAHRELHDVRAEVLKHRARLVVMLSSEQAERLEPELGPYRVRIERPPGAEVLQRYLRQAGLGADLTSRPSPVAARFLAGRPAMREIARFAEFIAEGWRRDGDGGDFVAWCEEAYAAVSRREAQVTDELRRLQTGEQRALLLATAMLHGAHADNVHHAAAALLREVEHPREELPVLERADLAERLRDIGAVCDDQDRVRFKDLGYAEAVRRHFWRYRPDLRPGIMAWVHGSVSSYVAQDDRDELVRRFTELCLSDRHLPLLVDLVKECTAEQADGARRRAAAQALSRGLQDQRHGHFFRKKIYEWSTQRGLSSALTEVLIAMCAEVMAVRHPYQAVVRLHHLARREGGVTRAREVLFGLVRADRRLLRLMFNRIDEQLTGTDRPYADADVDLFLGLADPQLLLDAEGRGLITQPAVREQVTTGWRVAFARRDEDAWGPAARAWLEAAGECGPRCDVLLDVIIEAGGPRRADILSRLYVMARDLERSHPAWRDHGVRLSDRVFLKINITLGIQAA